MCLHALRDTSSYDTVLVNSEPTNTFLTIGEGGRSPQRTHKCSQVQDTPNAFIRGTISNSSIPKSSDQEELQFILCTQNQYIYHLLASRFSKLTTSAHGYELCPHFPKRGDQSLITLQLLQSPSPC